MVIQVIQLDDLGNDFDIGVIEANKLHLKIDGITLIRNGGTGQLSVRNNVRFVS